MDIDEGTIVFRRRRYKDQDQLFVHTKSNNNCGCNSNNPYTTLNWSKNSCSCCHKKKYIKTAPNYITPPLDVRPLVHSPPIDVRLPITRSPLSTTSSLSNSISIGTCTKYTPKCFIPGGSRFSNMKLDKSFLKKDKCGLAQIWPNNINEVDDYWQCKIVFDRGKLPKLPTQTKTDLVTELIPEVSYNVEKGNLPNVNRKFYDINKNKRCQKFMKGTGCSSSCKNLHILPKEDGILCKFYFFYMQCYGNDCIYLHSERCSPEIKKACEDKLALDRCSRFLKFGECFKKKCNMIHRFPKDDGISCRSEVNACCSYGSKCWYLHRKDLNFSANDVNTHLDAAEKKSFNDIESKIELNMNCVSTVSLKDKQEVDHTTEKNNLSDNESSENHYDNYFYSSDSDGERTSYTGVGDLMSIIGKKVGRNISTPHSDDYLNSVNVSSISTYSNTEINFSKISRREHVNKSGKIGLKYSYKETNQRDSSSLKVHTQDEVNEDYSRPKLNPASGMTDGNEMTSILSERTRKSKYNISKVMKKNDTQTSHIKSLQSSDNSSTNYVDCIMESENPLCRGVGGLQSILKKKVERERVLTCYKTDSSSKYCKVSTMKNISSNFDKEYLNTKDKNGDNSVSQNLSKVIEMNSIDEYEVKCLDTAPSFNKDVNELLQISDSESSDNDNEYHFNKDPEVERLSYDGVGKLLESLVNIQKIPKHPNLNIPTTTTTGNIKNNHSIANKSFIQGANNASFHTTVNKSSILQNKFRNGNDGSIIKHFTDVNVPIKKEKIEEDDIIHVQNRHITNSNDSGLDMNYLDYDVPNDKIKEEIHVSNINCTEMDKFQVKNIKNEIIMDDSYNERCSGNSDVYTVLEEVHGSNSNDSDDTVIFNNTKSDTSKIKQTHFLKQPTNINKINSNPKCKETSIAGKSQLVQNSLEANKLWNTKTNGNHEISMKYNLISAENNSQPNQNSLEASKISNTKNTVNYKSPTKTMFNDSSKRNSKKNKFEKAPISKMVDTNYKSKNKSAEHKSSVNHVTCSIDKGTSTKQTILPGSSSTIDLNTKTSNKLYKIDKGKLKPTKERNLNHKKEKGPSSKYFHRFSFETTNTKENVNHNVEILPWQHLAKKMKKCFVKLVDIVTKAGNADRYVQNKIKRINKKPVPVKTRKTSFEDAINQFSPEISNKKNSGTNSKHSLNKSKVVNNDKLNRNSPSFKQMPSKLDGNEQMQKAERMVGHKNTHMKIGEADPKKKNSDENYKNSFLIDTPTKNHLSYLRKEKRKVIMFNEESTKKTQTNSLIQSEHKHKCLNNDLAVVKISHCDKSKSTFKLNADIASKNKNSKRIDNFQRNISKLTSFNKNNVTSESTMEDSLLLHKNKEESLIIDRQVNEDQSCSNSSSSQTTISSASTGKCHKTKIHKRKLTESASKLSNTKTKLIYSMESDTIKKNTHEKDSCFNSDSSEQLAENLIKNFSSPESNSIKRKISSNEHLSKEHKILFDYDFNEQRNISNISISSNYSDMGSPIPGSSSSDEIQYNHAAINKTISPIRITTFNIQDQHSETSSSIPLENSIISCDFIDDIHINQEIITSQKQSCSENVNDKHKKSRVQLKELDPPINIHDSSQNINQRQLTGSSDNSLSKQVAPNLNRKLQLTSSYKSTKISNNICEMASNVTNSLIEKNTNKKFSEHEIKGSLKKRPPLINRSDKLQSVRANAVITKIKSSMCNSSKESGNMSKENNVIDNISTKMTRKSSTSLENKIDSDVDDTDIPTTTNPEEEYILNAAKETLESFKDHFGSNRLSSQTTISSVSTGTCHKTEIHKRKLTESASKLSHKKTKLIYSMESDTIKKNTHEKDKCFNSDSSEQLADNLTKNFSSPESNSIKRKISSNENLSKKHKILFDYDSNEQKKIYNISSSISSNYSGMDSPIPGSSSSDEIQYNHAAINKTISPIRKTTFNIQDQHSETSSSIPLENSIISCDFIDDIHINQEIITSQKQSCSENVNDKHKKSRVQLKELDPPINIHDSSQNINQRQLTGSSDNSLSKQVAPNLNRKLQLTSSYKSTKISNNICEMASNVTNSLIEKNTNKKFSEHEIKGSLKKRPPLINRSDKLQSVRANAVITKIKSSMCNSSKESGNMSKENNVIDNIFTKMTRKSSTSLENKIDSDVDDTDIPTTTNPEEEYILNAAKETLESFKGRIYKNHNLCNAFITLCEDHSLKGVVRDNTVASLDKNIRLFWTSSFTKKYSLDNSCIDRVVNYDLNLKEFAAILKSMEDNFFT